MEPRNTTTQAREQKENRHDPSWPIFRGAWGSPETRASEGITGYRGGAWDFCQRGFLSRGESPGSPKKHPLRKSCPIGSSGVTTEHVYPRMGTSSSSRSPVLVDGWASRGVDCRCLTAQITHTPDANTIWHPLHHRRPASLRRHRLPSSRSLVRGAAFPIARNGRRPMHPFVAERGVVKAKPFTAAKRNRSTAPLPYPTCETLLDADPYRVHPRPSEPSHFLLGRFQGCVL